MKEGERFTVHAEAYHGIHGRTGLIIREFRDGLFWVRLDGSRRLWVVCLEEIVPESRNYDYDWQRERGLL